MNPSISTSPKIKMKSVRGRIRVLRAIGYRGSMIYIRQIDGDIFMYDVVFKEQIYSSHIEILPKEGASKLTKREISEATGIILAGATTTIDVLLGDKVDKKTKETVEAFEKAGRQMYGGES